MTRQQRERRQGSLRPSAVTIWAAMLLLAAVSSHAESQQMPGSASVAKPDDAEVALRGQRAAIRNINYGDWTQVLLQGGRRQDAVQDVDNRHL